MATVVITPVTPPAAAANGGLQVTASNGTAWATIPDVAVGSVLTSGGIGQNPAWSAVAVSRVLYVTTTPASNVGTGETTLAQYALDAGLLSTNGQIVRITAWGTNAANANNKTWKLYFGATVIASVGPSGVNNIPWEFRGMVIRSGPTSQTAGAFWEWQGQPAFFATSPTETLSGSPIIKVTGTSAIGSGDVTLTAFFVELLPASP